MTEEEARAWINEHFGVSRGTAVERYINLLMVENQRQNLISAATIPHVWARHLVDSAQLALLATGEPGHWVDIGSGAGLPGIVVALLSDRQVTLVEPRKKRSAFLQSCVEALDLTSRVAVIAASIERVPPFSPAPAVISARAVASLTGLLAMAHPLASKDTLWVLPKGRSAESEVAEARRTWHGRFDLMPSVTDPDARIVLIRRAAPR